jgi:hypothetical protein
LLLDPSSLGLLLGRRGACAFLGLAGVLGV